MQHELTELVLMLVSGSNVSVCAVLLVSRVDPIRSDNYQALRFSKGSLKVSRRLCDEILARSQSRVNLWFARELWKACSCRRLGSDLYNKRGCTSSNSIEIYIASMR